MTPGVRPMVAGNWKMNGLTVSLGEILAMRAAADSGAVGAVELVVCPPATLLSHASGLLRGGSVELGAQDCHAQANGAFTGDISAPMLKDIGCSYVIVGHSERRAGHGETDAAVRAKAASAVRAGLRAIVCIGETLEEREEGLAVTIVGAQTTSSLPPGADPRSIVVAYEPIWAIGTGQTPTPAEIAEMHLSIRGWLRGVYGKAGDHVRILYGGSVKPSNAKDFLRLPNVDGALVGGASLKASDFLAIASDCG